MAWNDRRDETKQRIVQALDAAKMAVGNYQSPMQAMSLNDPYKISPISPRVTGGSEIPAASGPSVTPSNNAGGLDPDEQWIISKESSGKTTAKNPRSSAFGLGQLIKANREAYAKKLGLSSPDTTDYNEQLAMFRAYVKDRYGSAKAAREFWEKNGWY